jgi:hypothetical protein
MKEGKRNKKNLKMFIKTTQNIYVYIAWHRQGL